MKKWEVFFMVALSIYSEQAYAQISYGNSLSSPITISLGQDASNPGSYYVLRPQHLVPSSYGPAQQQQIQLTAVLDTDRTPVSDVGNTLATNNYQLSSVSGNTLQLNPISVGRIQTQAPVLPLNQPLNVVKYTLVRSSADLPVSGGYKTQPRQETTQDQIVEAETSDDAPEDDEEDDQSPADMDEVPVANEGEKDSRNNNEDEGEGEEDESQAEAPVTTKPSRQRTSNSKKATSGRNRMSASSRRSKNRPVQPVEEIEEEAQSTDDAAVEEEGVPQVKSEEEEVPKTKSSSRRRNKNKQAQEETRSSSNKERRTKSQPTTPHEMEQSTTKPKSSSRVRTSNGGRKEAASNQSPSRKFKQTGRPKKPSRVQNEVTKGDQSAQGGYSISPAAVESISPGDEISNPADSGLVDYGAHLQLAPLNPESQNQVLSNLINSLQRTTPLNGGIASQVPSPVRGSPLNSPSQALENGYSSQQQQPVQGSNIPNSKAVSLSGGGMASGNYGTQSGIGSSVSYSTGAQSAGSHSNGGQSAGSYSIGGQSAGSYLSIGQSSGGYSNGGKANGGFSNGGQSGRSYSNGGQSAGSYSNGGSPAGSYSTGDSSSVDLSSQSGSQSSEDFMPGDLSPGSISSSPDIQVDSEVEYRVVPTLRYEVANGNYIVPSLDGDDRRINQAGDVQSSEQPTQNQITSQYQTQGLSQQQNSIQNQDQQQLNNQHYGSDYDDGLQTGSQDGYVRPQQGGQKGGHNNNQGQIGGQTNNQRSQFQSQPSVTYGVPGNNYPGEYTNDGWGSSQNSNEASSQGNGNQASSQFGDNGITNQRPIQSDNDYGHQYGAPPGGEGTSAEMALSMNQNPNAISSPLFGVGNPDAFSTPQGYEQPQGGNGIIPQNNLREAINLVSLFAQSQVTGQNTVAAENGAATQFSVSPSQVFIPTQEAAEEIFRDPGQNIRNSANGNQGSEQESSELQNSQYHSGYSNQQLSQNGFGGGNQLHQVQQQSGYRAQQMSTQNAGSQQPQYKRQQLGYSNQGSQDSLDSQEYQNSARPQQSQNGVRSKQFQSRLRPSPTQYGFRPFQSQSGLGSAQSQNGLGSLQQQSGIGSQQGYRRQSSQNFVNSEQTQTPQQGYRTQQRPTQTSSAFRNQQTQIQQLVYRNQAQQPTQIQQQSQEEIYDGEPAQPSSQQVVQQYNRLSQSSRQQPGQQQAYGTPANSDSDISSEKTKVTNLSLAYPSKSYGGRSQQQPIEGTAGKATQTIFRTISSLLTRSYRPQ